jgi:hypothetical protein
MPLCLHLEKHHHRFPILFPHFTVKFNILKTRFCDLLVTSAKSLQISFPFVNNAAFDPILSGLF